MKNRYTNKVCGVLLIVLAVISALIGLPTIAAGGVIFLAIGAFCLLFGVKLLKEAKKKPESPKVYVFVTQRGKKYHQDQDCLGLQNSKVKRIELSDAKNAGYTPCEMCATMRGLY